MAVSDLTHALVVATEIKGIDWLEEALLQVTQEFIDGVTVTRWAAVDSGVDGIANRTPMEILPHLFGALRIIKGGGAGGDEVQLDHHSRRFIST